MKPILPLLIVAICSVFAVKAPAAEEEKGAILSGFVEAVDGNKITVNHRRQSKVFTINDQAKIHYVGFLDAAKEIKPGFVVRAHVDAKGGGNALWVTLPIPKEKLIPTAEMLKMTPTELHKMADSNADGELSYVEYATAFYRSPKHGPIRFPKSDKDKSGTLNLKEFERDIADMKWLRMSRKTPAEWHAEVDADSNGVLNKKEFVTFLGTTAHLDTRVKQADKDKSGGISVEELAGFIDSMLK